MSALINTYSPKVVVVCAEAIRLGRVTTEDAALAIINAMYQSGSSLIFAVINANIASTKKVEFLQGDPRIVAFAQLKFACGTIPAAPSISATVSNPSHD